MDSKPYHDCCEDLMCCRCGEFLSPDTSPSGLGLPRWHLLCDLCQQVSSREEWLHREPLVLGHS